MTKILRSMLFLGLLAATAVVRADSPPVPAGDLSDEQRHAEFGKLAWQAGPFKGPVGEKARIAIPKDSRLLPQGKTDRFFELTGNLPEPGSTVVVQGDWFAVFSFTDSGYIKDDEKLDPDAILKAIRDRDDPSNEARAKRGLPKMHTVGWMVPPHYDGETRHLEWGLKIQPDDAPEPVVNYTVRLLGRTGYENVILVSDPQSLDHDVKDLKALLADFDFNSGERYAEFKPGDRVAEFGLGALIVGGAAAAAVKTGFWKVILGGILAAWKFIAVGAVALFAGIRKFFSGRKPQ